MVGVDLQELSDCDNPMAYIIDQAGGFLRVANWCNVAKRTVQYWSERGLPSSEYVGRTQYAHAICQRMNIDTGFFLECCRQAQIKKNAASV